MPSELEVEFRGIDESIVRLRGRQERLDRGMKRLAEGAARTGAEVMRAEIPKETGQTALRIDHTDATWHPGGLGGGGTWEASFGVRDVPGPENEVPTWITKGTGLFGEHHSLIKPLMGNILAFWWARKGVKVFTPFVKGQAPNDRWVRESHEAAEAYIAMHLAYVYEEIASQL